MVIISRIEVSSNVSTLVLKMVWVSWSMLGSSVRLLVILLVMWWWLATKKVHRIRFSVLMLSTVVIGCWFWIGSIVSDLVWLTLSSMIMNRNSITMVLV